MKNSCLTVCVEQDEDRFFIGSGPEIPSRDVQGKNQKEMLKNLRHVLRLCLRNLGQKTCKSKF